MVNLSDRQETDVSEYQVRSPIAIIVVEIFGFKVTLFFTNFSKFRVQQTNPVKSDFLNTTLRNAG